MQVIRGSRLNGQYRSVDPWGPPQSLTSEKVSDYLSHDSWPCYTCLLDRLQVNRWQQFSPVTFYSFLSLFLFVCFEPRSRCVALAGLELPLQTRNPLPPQCWPTLCSYNLQIKPYPAAAGWLNTIVLQQGLRGSPRPT